MNFFCLDLVFLCAKLPNGNYRCHITKHFNKLRTISLRILVVRMSNFRKLLSTTNCYLNV